jgi:hypothetical protein
MVVLQAGVNMAEKLMLEGFKSFIGKHCETTALKRALDYHGLDLSEEMLLGLGGGIGFIYWYMKIMPSPFIGGRNGKVAEFAVTACKRLGAEVAVMETASAGRGYEELKALLRNGEPAVTYVDMAYLPYLAVPEQAHFGGHVVAVFGLDEDRDVVHIYDRGRNPVTAGIADLARARASKFPTFPPKHRLLKIKYPARIGDLGTGIKDSILECCNNMLKPPIKNIGLAGMQKWAEMVVKWPQQFKGLNLLGALMNGFMYIEIGGTGGSAFRYMYARFLEEASSIINQPLLKEVADMMRQSAVIWSQIADGFLPDSWPYLKRMRQLIVEKNRLFEEQEPGALKAMLQINREFDVLMKKAVDDLSRPPAFLADVQRSILRCRDIESQAFQSLSNIVDKPKVKD